MKVVIFGASGSLGMHLLQQCLNNGIHVVAFTRNPPKFKDFTNDQLLVIQGDVLNKADVENAIKDVQAVFCTLGDGAKGKIRSSGTKCIVNAMEKYGISRIICQTTLGCGESWNNLNFFWKYVMFSFFLRKAFQDHKLQEEYIMRSNLNYTIVRPSAFTDEPLTKEFKIDFNEHEKSLKLKISRASIAHFMMRQLDSKEFIRKTVSISN